MADAGHASRTPEQPEARLLAVPVARRSSAGRRGRQGLWRRVLGVLLPLLACCAAETSGLDPVVAQRAVDEVVQRHPELVRLTIHAVPAGGATSVILACNLPEKLGAPSDPEDLAAMTTGRTTILREGERFDVTAPLRASDGTAFAATGITLELPSGADEADARQLAERIRVELEQALGAGG